MKTRTKNIIIVALGLFFLFLDRLLKIIAINNLGKNILYKNLIGFEPYLNPGVAFSIPLPNFVTIIFSLLIIFLLIALAYFQPQKYFSAISISIFGAVSNLTDRIIYTHTIDYFRIFTSIINLADVLIVIGFILLFLKTTQIKKG